MECMVFQRLAVYVVVVAAGRTNERKIGLGMTVSKIS
jgi:hypothetical protein